LKKKYSIKENKAVQQVLAQGYFVKCPSCVVYVLKNGTNKNNVAFLAGKKLGNSPIRNKAKRKLRVAMSTYWRNLLKGYDIVLIARPFLLHREQHMLIKDLESLLKKHKILGSGDIFDKSDVSMIKKNRRFVNEKTV